MRLVETPTLFPAVTLHGHGGECVDTEAEIVAGGRVYVSRVEAGEIARHFGFLTPESAAQKDARIAMLEGELAEALKLVDRIRRDVLASV